MIAFTSWDIGQNVYCNSLLPGCDVKNSEISLIFLIKLFFDMIENSRQKFKYLENEKRFYGEIKSIFHHFKRAFRYQKMPQTWECIFNPFVPITLSLPPENLTGFLCFQGVEKGYIGKEWVKSFHLGVSFYSDPYQHSKITEASIDPNQTSMVQLFCKNS